QEPRVGPYEHEVPPPMLKARRPVRAAAPLFLAYRACTSRPRLRVPRRTFARSLGRWRVGRHGEPRVRGGALVLGLLFAVIGGLAARGLDLFSEVRYLPI